MSIQPNNLPVYPSVKYPKYSPIWPSWLKDKLFDDELSVREKYTEQESMIKDIYNTSYRNGSFLRSIIELLIEYSSVSGADSDIYAYYPDESEHDFDEGLICLAIGWDEPGSRVYITERECFKYSKEACMKFLEKYPQFHDLLTGILDNWKPKYPDKYPDAE